MGLLREYGYNWRTDSYDYALKSELLIPNMIALVKDTPELAINVLNAAAGVLTPTYIQKLLWNYISSNYQNVNIESIDDHAISRYYDALAPAVTNPDFSALLLVFNNNNFFGLIEHTMKRVFDEQMLIDTTYLHSLIRNYYKVSMEYERVTLYGVLDLYDFMAYKKMPAQLYSENVWHRIIAALSEAYKGKDRAALDHFKKAVQQNNRGLSYRGMSKPYFKYIICNFLYVLICYRSHIEEGRKKALTISKSMERQATLSAKALHGILYRSMTEKQLQACLSSLLTSEYLMDRMLAKIMYQHIGKEPDVNEYHEVNPTWAILKDNTLLTSLPELPVLIASEERPTRIAYFMTCTRAVVAEKREQSMLKNGKWGVGKRVGGHYPVERLLPAMVSESRLYAGRYAPYTLVEVVEEAPYISIKHDRHGYHVYSNIPMEMQWTETFITHRTPSRITFMHLTTAQRDGFIRFMRKQNYRPGEEEELKALLKEVDGMIEVHCDLLPGGSTLPICDGSGRLTMQIRPFDKHRYEVEIFVRPVEGGRLRCIPGEGQDVVIDTIQRMPVITEATVSEATAENTPTAETQESAESTSIAEPQESAENTSTAESQVAADAAESPVLFAPSFRTRIKRNLAAETANLDHIILTTGIIWEQVMTLDAFDILPLLEYAQQNPDRIVCEWPEGTKLKVKQRSTSSAWSGVIKKNENGWFEIEGSVEIDQNKVISMAQLLDLAKQSHGRYIQLSDGEFLALSDKLRQQLNRLSTIASRSHGKVQLSKFTAAVLGADIFNGELYLEEDKELREIRKRIKETSTYMPPVPENLNATLREYQKEGFQWMSRLNSWGAGALLADDMGLGKTIQTISFLLSKSEEGPALVIAPASVAPNWKTEFEKFAPSLNVIMLNYEQDRRGAIKKAKAGDVIVMTYMLLLSVKDDITKKQWKTICLDEAHIIKNRGAKTSAVAMKLQSDYRVMLTGTPVQNHLGELWNLFQFVNPGLLGGFDDFSRRFIQPIELLQDKETQAELDHLIKPFMLRRTKEKVAKELPEKQEIYQHVSLAEDEMARYEAVRQRAEQMLLSDIQADKSHSVGINTLAEITRLRLCACGESKMQALVELLDTIQEGGGATLVFSQFTSYLSQIKDKLDSANIPYLYIDGSVPIKERHKLVEQFQSAEVEDSATEPKDTEKSGLLGKLSRLKKLVTRPKAPTTPSVFLISLKAGGLGLNLTRANYVIHMDPWWNPAIEQQATDRAHRIGQKQAVTVYHLISEGTIEEKIQRLHKRKKDLVENILDSTDMSHKLTGEELLEMIQR